MSARKDATSRRNIASSYRTRRSSLRKLSSEEVDVIRTNKLLGYTDREIAQMTARSLGVVGKYTKGLKANLGAGQSIPTTQLVQTPAFSLERRAPSPGEKLRQSSLSSEAKLTLAAINRLRKLEADYRLSQSPDGRMLLANLQKISKINETLDRLNPKLGFSESQSSIDWRKGFQQKVETALEHFRLGTHRSIDSLEHCLACKLAFVPPPPMA